MIVCEKNFKGTVKELIVATTKVIEFAVNKKIQQQFILLAPSHMGGTWERLLITVSWIMYKIAMDIESWILSSSSTLYSKKLDV